MPQTSRVVLNRATFAALDLAQADALFDVAVRVLEVVNVPDASPYGKGLIEGGGALAFLGNKKVNGTTIGGRQIKKPRALKGVLPSEAVAIVGFGFPGRFVELGTIDTHAEPFLTPAAMSIVGSEAEVIISESIGKRLAGIRSF